MELVASTMVSYLKIYTLNAAIAGLCGSISSVFGKLSGMYDTTTSVSLALKITFFILMVVFNTAVWTFFVKALCTCSSSLPPTITSAATNYVCSAFLGYLLFGEIITILWWSGTFLILTGLMVITCSQNANSHSEKNE